VIGFYFSGHWCPPCRMFTPELVKFYNKLKEEGKSFEIVFVSSDKDQAGFNEYFAEMPWKALPFKDPRVQLLKQKFQIRGIPALVLVDNTGKTISTNGRSLVEEDPTGFPWPPKALLPIGKSCIEALNTTPCAIFFPADSKREEQKNLWNTVAEEYFKKFEEKKVDHPLLFLYDSGNKDPIIAKITETFGFGNSRPLLVILNIQGQVKYV